MNESDVIKTYELLGHSKVEIRIIDTNADEVRYDDMVNSDKDFVKVCSQYDGKANIYAGLNQRKHAKAGKVDIEAVLTIPIDLDPVRENGNQKEPTTDEEMQCAVDAAQAVKLWFRQKGFESPSMAMSGNGVALWCPIPRYELNGNLESWETKLKAFLVQVSSVIPENLRDKVKLDTNVFDVTRIFKVVGTKSVKGTHTSERPHRVSYWIDEPKRVEDDKLLKYVLSMQVSSEKPSVVPSVRQKGVSDSFSLPQLSNTQNNVLKMALRHPYVTMARRKMNYHDVSKSDWAFLSELRKEGITDRDMLTYALATCSNTKYERDERGDYVSLTVKSFISKLPGINLEEGRNRLEKEMDELSFEKSNKTNLVHIGAGISLGKTYKAIDLVFKMVEAGEKVLAVIPLHILGDEWHHQLQVRHGVTAIQLYGVSHEKVHCPFVDKAKFLLGLGHSQLFKQRYCLGKCTRMKDCLHIFSLEHAKSADVLIATHGHSGVHQSFFKLRSLDNDERSLVIIDEMPTLVNPVRMKLKTLRANLRLFNILRGSKTEAPIWMFSELTKGLEQALLARREYELSENLSGGISQQDISRTDYLIARYHIDNKKRPTKNLLWDLSHILNTNIPVKYDISQDAMIYRWTPEFRSNQNVVIMSGTAKSAYIEKQVKKDVSQTIGEKWNVRRENVKIVQMLNVVGGRNRLIRDCEKDNLQANLKEFFDLALYKHENQRIVIVCSLGEGALGFDSAKGRVIRILTNIADRHERKLVAIGKDEIQDGTIPDGLTEIPVLHWGLIGIDILKGRFDVVIETNCHFFHPDAIIQAVYDKFDYDASEIEAKEDKIKFYSVDQEFDLIRYVYEDELLELEIGQTERASIEQTEGRFLREDDIYKVIYRLFNANVKPYPHRVYKSWKALFEYEFYPFAPPEVLAEKLTGKAKEVWTWICENAGGGEFTANEVAESFKLDVNYTRRELDKLVALGCISISKHGGRGRKNPTIFAVTDRQEHRRHVEKKID